MPEGHTLARIAHGLRTAFADRPVRVSSPQGRFAAEAALLDRSVLTGAESAGKHLFIEFAEAQVVHVHLGLIGGFEIRSGPPPDPVGQIRLRLVGEAPEQRRTPTCAGPPAANWSPRTSGQRWWPGWARTRCGATLIRSEPGCGSGTGRARSGSS